MAADACDPPASLRAQHPDYQRRSAMPGTTAQPDAAAAERHLVRLARLYPAFRFTREPFGWKGARWVAERLDRPVDGLHVVITDDLTELQAALAADKDRRAR
jgi:hypothetical protein